MSETSVFISEDNKATVEAALKDAISSQFSDVELVEVRYFKQYGSNTVELLIWKKSGISLNDCEAVHNLVSDELDKLDDLFLTAYTLNISSLGLDRKIVTDDDFRRALETEIECVDKDKKKTVGVLEAYDSESITVISGTQKKTLLRNNLTKVQPYVRF